MILDDAQLRKVTGKKHRDAQRKVLVAMGIDHIVRPDGSLVVSEQLVRHLLGEEVRTTLPSSPEPDWEACAQGA